MNEKLVDENEEKRIRFSAKYLLGTLCFFMIGTLPAAITIIVSAFR